MKILLSTHGFSPQVGGIESCSLMLAKAFVEAGHQVKVVTLTPSSDPQDDLGLEVIRLPGWRDVRSLLRWCDVCFHNNICVHLAWPLLFLRRPWIVTTATWIRNANGRERLIDRLKRWSLRWAENIYISEAVAAHVGHRGTIIFNPYDPAGFPPLHNVERDRDLVFLGRLVSDKGCDLVLHALARLASEGLHPCLSIIGDGPEEALLRDLARSLVIEEQVLFHGRQTGHALNRLLHQHRIMVVPSRWKEPFGIVALEGIAAGCWIVGSADGGLRDAIGRCGETFANGNLEALTSCLRKALQHPLDPDKTKQHRDEHLRQFELPRVADAYLDVFSKARRRYAKELA